MRKISGDSIARFVGLVGIEAGLSVAATRHVVMPLFGPDFRGIAAVISTLLIFYGLAIAAFRFLQRIAPVPVGDIEIGSVAEQRSFLYTLHYLLLFNPLIFSRTMPVPLMRLVLQALGARMGNNSYCAGVMMDPQFVTMGQDSLIGNSAMIIPHVLEGARFGFYPVRIGNRVTIGARAIVMADVEIGDDATVAIQSVVTKGTRIAAGETWGGVPARCIRHAK